MIILNGIRINTKIDMTQIADVEHNNSHTIDTWLVPARSSVITEKVRSAGIDIDVHDVPESILQEFDLHELPRSIGIIGGAARAVALRLLTGENSPIRDIDLLALDELGIIPEDQRLDLSRVYMPDDTAYGHPMAREESISRYFRTRDLTINEIIVVDGALILTAAAKQALTKKMIVPTQYETYWGNSIGPKITIKALLMSAVFEIEFGGSEIDATLCDNVDDFYIALGFNKAFQYGQEVAVRFVELLCSKGYVEEPDVHGIRGLAERVAQSSGFEYRGFDLGVLGVGIDQDEPSYERLARLIGRIPGILPVGVMDELR